MVEGVSVTVSRFELCFGNTITSLMESALVNSVPKEDMTISAFNYLAALGTSSKQALDKPHS